MITLPWWLLVLLLLLVLAVTVWVTIHITMWAGGRLEAEERGGDKNDYPFSWRVVMGADIYFGWLEREARKDGRIVDG